MKKLLASLRISVLSLLGASILRCLNATLRWHNLGLLQDRDFWDKGGPHITAFWHNQQLVMPWIYLDFPHRNPIWVLISEHNDGRIIARIIERLGLCSVAGSSTRGGLRGLLELSRRVKDGGHVAITPDGPRGPVYKSKIGALILAQRTGKPIHPMACAAQKKWVFGSWDRMFLPKPFSKAARYMGEPLVIPKELDEAGQQKYLDELDRRLNEATQIVESYQYA